MEGGITAASILFEKYQVTDIVYESDTVTVYVAEHIYMSVKRIIKKILKKSICRDNFYSEIAILKSIKNPQIPIVYDVEEDNFAYYIIEEYIEGINLHTFIEDNGVISENAAIDIGIKICDIVSFLHCQKPIPILFLDIHPKNILINTSDDDKIFLVDFGSSYYSNETEKRKLLMGTIGYAAPEQYRESRLDERADIYGIGAVLYFLVTGQSLDRKDTHSLNFPTNISEKFKMIVLQCVAHDKNDRFQNVCTLAENLSKIHQSDNISITREKSHIISFAGVDRRVGVTHICLAFAFYLSCCGYSVMYEETNDSNHLRMIAGTFKLKYKDGFFYRDNLVMMPKYGEQISLERHSHYIVRDIGLFSEDKINDSDSLVIVAGAKAWELDNSVSICKKAMAIRDVHVICTSCERNQSLSLWRRIEYVGMQAPVLGDLFTNNNASKFFEELACVIGIGREGGATHKKRKRFFKKIAKKARRNNSRRMGCS